MQFQHLLDFLSKHKYLILPGLGELSMSTKLTSYDALNQIVHPSKFRLDFMPTGSNSYYDQVLFIANESGQDEAKIDTILQAFSASIKKDLLASKEVHLPFIGYLSFIQDIVVFETSHEWEKRQNYFRNSVAVHKVFEQDTKVENHSPLEFSSSQQIEAIQPIVLNETIETSQSSEANEAEIVYLSRPKYYKYVAAILLIFTFSAIGVAFLDSSESWLHPVTYDLDSLDYSADRINRSPITDGTEANIDRVIAEVKEAEEVIQESKNRLQLEKKPTIADIPAIDENENTRPASQEDCIYVLGSFKALKNANKLKDKLVNSGFTLYEENFKGNTRVGAQIHCQDQQKIEALRSIEDKAWLLN